MQQHQQEGDRVQENENETQREREALTPERFFSFDKTNDINTNKHQCQKKPLQRKLLVPANTKIKKPRQIHMGALFFPKQKTGKRH